MSAQHLLVGHTILQLSLAMKIYVPIFWAGHRYKKGLQTGTHSVCTHEGELKFLFRYFHFSLPYQYHTNVQVQPTTHFHFSLENRTVRPFKCAALTSSSCLHLPFQTQPVSAAHSNGHTVPVLFADKTSESGYCSSGHKREKLCWWGW